MKVFNNYIVLLFFIFLTGCASAPKQVSPEKYQEFEKLVLNKNYTINSNWAYPMASNSLNQLQNTGLFPIGSNASTIDVSGTSNYFTIKNDSIFADLPYFGERQMGGNYNSSDIGINIKSPLENVISEKDKNGNYIIKLSAKDSKNHTESYRITARLFQNNTTSIFINSSHRTPIQFRGIISKISE